MMSDAIAVAEGLPNTGDTRRKCLRCHEMRPLLGFAYCRECYGFLHPGGFPIEPSEVDQLKTCLARASAALYGFAQNMRTIETEAEYQRLSGIIAEADTLTGGL